MVVNNNNISQVVSILRKEVKNYDVPVVTLIALRSKDPYKVLISTIISARTKDQVTSEASRRLFNKASSLKKLARLSEKEIAKLIYPAGFYNTKARNIRKTAKILLEEHKGKIPDEIDELIKLPGVGRKTANLVLSEGFRKHSICVDTHVHRISNRLGYVKTKTPAQTEQALREKLPKRHWIEYNTILVAFGQNTCTPVSPWCSRCPVNRYCPKIGVGKSR